MLHINEAKNEGVAYLQDYTTLKKDIFILFPKHIQLYFD